MRRLPRMHLPAPQRGAALLILLALFATAAIYMLVTSLNKSSVALMLARSEKNRAVMQEAKAALIAWAASETSQPPGGQGFQPGALPCPDVDNNGTQDYFNPTTCTSLLGRLPYQTLGIADLRDASGERLWYAVSNNFVRSTNNVINSDKQGTLTITGLAPASKVIAVVLAPGTGIPVVGQNRGAAGVNTAFNYLENTNGIANSTNFVTATENLTDAANSFNDQLLAVTHQDLFSVVEPVVAARIERDIVRQFIYDPSAPPGDTSKLYGEWERFPFAAPFVDPSTSNFKGQTATYEGLLPVIATLPYNWNTGGAITVTQMGGSGTVSADCSSSSGNQLNCRITQSLSWLDAWRINAGWDTYSAGSFKMTATINDVGTSFVFVKRPTISNVSTSNPSVALTNPVVSSSLDASAVATATLNATLPFTFYGSSSSTCFSGDSGSKSIRVKISRPAIDGAIGIASTGSGDIAGWFNNNEWYKLTYYAVVPRYTPGGAGNCAPWSDPWTNLKCLSVDNVAPTATNPNPTTSTRAIVILAGRSLGGALRPNGNRPDYLEGKNASTGDFSFEHGLGKTTTPAAPVAINDRVIVIAP